MSVHRTDPVADQVERLLRERIQNGNYAQDKRLPSEGELAKEYGVSRSTIRAALSVLAAEQLVRRKPGIGTFVNEHIIQLSPNIDNLWEHSYYIENAGKSPSIKTLSASARSPTEAETEALHITPDEKVYAMERLFLADDQPIVYSHNIVPVRLFRAALLALDTNIEIRLFMREYCEQELTHVVANLSSAHATADIAEALGLDENTPVLHFNQFFYTVDSLPAVYADNYYNDKLLKIRIARPINPSD